jgi:3-oxoadipate enol-lactonase / 4-carboxymuconolactone decarboxylase
MPFATIDNHRVFYRLEGKTGAPVLVLSHSIGTDHGMWSEQVEDLLPYFQILRYDTRGHGASDAPAGDYSIEQLGRDIIGLADFLGISTFSFCGISLGGAIAQWLGIYSPDRMTKLIIANSSPQFGPPASWEERRKAALKSGMAEIDDVAMQRFFSAEMLSRPDVHAEAIRNLLLGTNPLGYAGCCAALRDFDCTKQLHKIQVSTLLVVGEKDVSTPWEGHGEILAREIPGARVVRLPAAHLSNLERPRSFTAELLEFLRPRDTSSDQLKAGFAIRREVLGDAHVDRAIAATTDFTRDFQDLITKYAWGTIWSRPGLDQRTRRLLTLAIAASLGRWEEFAMHVRTGLAHDLEPCDLKEILLQTAIYAGVPAANTGFQLASEEMEKSTRTQRETPTVSE